MSTLSRRLRLLEQRAPSTPICAEHPISIMHAPNWQAALRDSLRAFSPDEADRAAYNAEQDVLEATPPCARCGWRPTAIRIQVATDWKGHDREPVA